MRRELDYGRAAGLVFLTIAVVHLIRAFAGWELVVNGLLVPLWFSWLVVVVAAALGLTGIKHGK